MECKKTHQPLQFLLQNSLRLKRIHDVNKSLCNEENFKTSHFRIYHTSNFFQPPSNKPLNICHCFGLTHCTYNQMVTEKQQLRINLCYLISLRHLIRTKEVAIRFFFFENTYYPSCVRNILPSNLSTMQFNPSNWVIPSYLITS